MVGVAAVVPVEEDDVSRGGGGAAVQPLVAVFEPVDAGFAPGEVRHDAAFDIAALVGAPRHKAGAPVHARGEAHIAPIGLAAHISYLRQGDGDDLSVACSDSVQDAVPERRVLLGQELGELLPLLKEDDLLILTADHGNDPTHIDFNHTREYVFCLMCGKSLRKGVDLGTRKTFADIGATVADYLIGEKKPTEIGESFLELIKA